jgi:hypothetical protein
MHVDCERVHWTVFFVVILCVSVSDL